MTYRIRRRVKNRNSHHRKRKIYRGKGKDGLYDVIVKHPTFAATAAVGLGLGAIGTTGIGNALSTAGNAVMGVFKGQTPGRGQEPRQEQEPGQVQVPMQEQEPNPMQVPNQEVQDAIRSSPVNNAEYDELTPDNAGHKIKFFYGTNTDDYFHNSPVQKAQKMLFMFIIGDNTDICIQQLIDKINNCNKCKSENCADEKTLCNDVFKTQEYNHRSNRINDNDTLINSFEKPQHKLAHWSAHDINTKVNTLIEIYGQDPNKVCMIYYYYIRVLKKRIALLQEIGIDKLNLMKTCFNNNNNTFEVTVTNTIQAVNVVIEQEIKNVIALIDIFTNKLEEEKKLLPHL